MEEKLKAFESDNISLRSDVSCLRLQNEKVFQIILFLIVDFNTSILQNTRISYSFS
jgi:hypothetical protein